MQCIAVVLASIMALAASSAVNYCGSRMCANTNAHTFCQFPEGPSRHCVGYISAPLNIEEKSRVIARLNRRRNEAASGDMRGLPSAGNMLKLRWVEELAREAQRWADQCRPPRTIEEHDVCRNLYSLTVGQCVASVVGEAPGLRVESMVDIWYMQSMLYKGNVTFYMPASQNGSFYGDFAQIIWARSYMVGCGRSRFMTPWQGRLRSVERLVCNIAPMGPPPSRPLWNPAAPAAMCPPRSQQDAMLPALCDYHRNLTEPTVFDASMSLTDHLILNTVLEIESNETRNYLGSLDEIYLTKMAIATIENSPTTLKYNNSIQRRDVVEVIDVAEVQSNISTPILLTEMIPAPNSTLQPDEETKPIIKTKTSKKKISLIGRPKTYNMEDLTNIDENTENNTPIEEIPKKEKEFYAEYEFIEPVDDNTSTSSDITNTAEVSTLVNVVINQDILREVVTRLYQNSSMLDGVSINNMIDAMVKSDASSSSVSSAVSYSAQDSGNASFVTKDNIDDYLSDPETVRELQEALERIELDMAPKFSQKEKQGKVRRELRDFPEDDSPTNIKKRFSEDQYNEEVERNKTLDRSPMYNMVLKYMPYLKQYEGGILQKSADDSSSSSRCLSPVLMLVVTLCL